MTNPSRECWRPIAGFEDHYEVSDQGRVRTIRTGRIRKQQTQHQGYRIVTLYANRVKVTALVHRLVAEAFCERREGCDVIRHLDGSRDNNVPVNLAWGTHHENNLDSVRHGTHYGARRTHRPHGHPLDGRRTAGERYCRTCIRNHYYRTRDVQRPRVLVSP